MEREREQRRGVPGGSRWTTLGSIAAIVVSLGLLAWTLPLEALLHRSQSFFAALGPKGAFLFAAVYAVATLLAIPGSLLTAVAGALFGPLLGTATVSLGSNVGAALAFLFARHFAREAVARRLRDSPRLRALDRAIGRGGWRVVALLRLAPVVPFNVQNYFYGLTSIGLWPTVATSFLAMLPGTFLYVLLGHLSASGLTAAGEPRQVRVARWVLLGVGLVATVTLAILLGRFARRALREWTERDVPQRDVPQRVVDDSEPEASRGGRSLVLPSIALLAVLATVLAVAKRDVIGRLLGPPAVRSVESYAQDRGTAHFDHSLLDGLLRRHVDAQGFVDYRGLWAERDQLVRYLVTLADAPVASLSRDERLALLLNAYDAFTLELVLEHFADGALASIRDVPAAERWQARRFELGGRTLSLDQLEHEEIRPHFVEPRVHFALVCAAVGCPPLRNEAYRSEVLEAQLEDQMRTIHSHATWFRFDEDLDTVWLTPLYDWYAGDFEQVAGSVLDFAARAAPALRAARERGAELRVRWLDYDWSLNDVANRAPR